MYKLTKVDRILVMELLNNSRTSIKEISKKFGISRSSISNRIKILEEKGILSGYNVDFNPTFVGIFPVGILIKTKKIPEINEIKEITKDIPNIYRCSLCAGPFNIQIRMYIHKLEEMQKIMEKFNQTLEIEDFEYLINTERTFFLRDFLGLGLKINQVYGPFHYGLKLDMKCNRTELKILTLLTQNCRLSMSAIAKIIKKPLSTVNFCFKKLKEKKVIEKFSTFINVTKFGYSIDHIKIRVKESNEIIDKKIFKFCRDSDEIFIYNKTFGKWNYNLQLFVKSAEETYLLVKQLQKEVPEIDKLDVFRIYAGYSHAVDFNKLVKGLS